MASPRRKMGGSRWGWDDKLKQNTFTKSSKGGTITSWEQFTKLIPDYANYSFHDLLKSPYLSGKGAYTISPKVYKSIQDNFMATEKSSGLSVNQLASTPFGQWGNIPHPGGGEDIPFPGDGSGAGVPWASTEAGVRYQQEQAMALLREEQRLLAEREAAQRMEELKAKRQQIFSEMLGQDPVRAVLFAMGLSGAVPGSTKEETASLQPLEGIDAYKRNTENALTEALNRGNVTGAGPISIGAEGVKGLPSAIKAQNLFTTGAGMVGGANLDLQKVLASAFGVGQTTGAQQGAAGTQTGLNPEELIRQIQDVTPRGIL